MSDPIEPVFDADQWRDIAGFDRGHGDMQMPDEIGRRAWDGNWAACIALANAALPDDDRKITRGHIAALRNATVRDVIGDEDREQTNILRNLADALESYLPPEDA